MNKNEAFRELLVGDFIGNVDIEKESFTTQYLGEPWSCRTCEYGPKPERLYNAACNNCIDGSNFWRKKETNETSGKTN